MIRLYFILLFVLIGGCLLSCEKRTGNAENSVISGNNFDSVEVTKADSLIQVEVNNDLQESDTFKFDDFVNFRKLWSTNHTGLVSVLSKDIFVHNFDTICRFDLNTGKQIGSINVEGFYADFIDKNRILFAYSLSDSIFIFQNSEFVKCINMYSGNELWSLKRNFTHKAILTSGFTVIDSSIYVIEDNKKVVCRNVYTGKEKWDFQTKSLLQTDIFAWEDFLIIIDAEKISFLNRDYGKIVENIPLKGTCNVNPVLYDETLYLVKSNMSSDDAYKEDKIYKINLKKKKIDFAAETIEVINMMVDSNILLINSYHEVQSLDRGTLKVKWRYEPVDYYNFKKKPLFWKNEIWLWMDITNLAYLPEGNDPKYLSILDKDGKVRINDVGNNFAESIFYLNHKDSDLICIQSKIGLSVFNAQ